MRRDIVKMLARPESGYAGGRDEEEALMMRRVNKVDGESGRLGTLMQGPPTDRKSVV